MGERIKRLRWLTVAGAASSLAACATPADQPLAVHPYHPDYSEPASTVPYPVPLAPAPPPVADPRPEWTGGGPQAPEGATPAAYAWIDQAIDLLDVVGEAPPDFTFGHGGRTLYGWDIDGWLLIEAPAEPTRRLFLFAPGSRQPYFARDHQAGHGFENGRLAATYLPDGRVVPGSDLWRWRNHADGLRREAFAIFEAARSARSGGDFAAYDEEWYGWAPGLVSIWFEWEETRRREREWRDYRRERDSVRDAAREEQRRRRREAALAFRRWRASGFEGPPPPGIDPRRWDRNGDGIPDRRRRNRDRDGDGRPDRPRDRDGDGLADRPRDRDGDGEPDRRLDRDGDGLPDRPLDRADRPDRPTEPDQTDQADPVEDGVSAPQPPAPAPTPMVRSPFEPRRPVPITDDALDPGLSDSDRLVRIPRPRPPRRIDAPLGPGARPENVQEPTHAAPGVLPQFQSTPVPEPQSAPPPPVEVSPPPAPPPPPPPPPAPPPPPPAPLPPPPAPPPPPPAPPLPPPAPPEPIAEEPSVREVQPD